jgi:sterol desaturase/sphingolipid hydroxylase (fatty acid hydroxylase superfamily)
MMSTPRLVTLLVIGLLGHVMALFWFCAVRGRWRLASRVIYAIEIPRAQIRRELRNSLHAPIHAILLACVLVLGSFDAVTARSFVATLLLTTLWAEVWHYASHRAFHLKSLHWIHEEHHKSHLNSWLTAISFSFSEKLIFDVGLIGPLAALDLIVSLNFYGIAGWYVGYLLINSFSHANFELKSGQYVYHAGRVFTSTTYHSLHHARYTGNYGLGTRVLDRIFRTEWPDYDKLYVRIAEDRTPLTRLSERV